MFSSSTAGAPPGPLNASLYGGIYSDPHNECDDPYTSNLYVGNLSPAGRCDASGLVKCA